jgi:hypothetical protein
VSPAKARTSASLLAEGGTEASRLTPRCRGDSQNDSEGCTAQPGSQANSEPTATADQNCLRIFHCDCDPCTTTANLQQPIQGILNPAQPDTAYAHSHRPVTG